MHSFHLANTQRKVEDFSARVEKFHARFESSGPGAVGEDLEKGLELLKVCVCVDLDVALHSYPI